MHLFKKPFVILYIFIKYYLRVVYYSYIILYKFILYISSCLIIEVLFVHLFFLSFNFDYLRSFPLTQPFALRTFEAH